jgi:hypothetical protein
LLHNPLERITSHHVAVAVSHAFLALFFFYTSKQKPETLPLSGSLQLLAYLFFLCPLLLCILPICLSLLTLQCSYPHALLCFCLPCTSHSINISSSLSSSPPETRLSQDHSYYTSLSPKTRLMVGGGMIGYACLGLFLADTAEEKLGYTPTEEDKKRLREALPKIRVVDE